MALLYAEHQLIVMSGEGTCGHIIGIVTFAWPALLEASVYRENSGPSWLGHCLKSVALAHFFSNVKCSENHAAVVALAAEMRGAYNQRHMAVRALALRRNRRPIFLRESW